MFVVGFSPLFLFSQLSPTLFSYLFSVRFLFPLDISLAQANRRKTKLKRCIVSPPFLDKQFIKKSFEKCIVFNKKKTKCSKNRLNS
jgi:hypothetical protein